MLNLISDIHLHCGLKGFAADGHPDYEDFTIWDYYPPQEEALQKLNFASTFPFILIYYSSNLFEIQ